MEHNTLQISGVLEKQYPPRVSPAGVAHQDILMVHRSRQLEAGLAREVRLTLMVHLAGALVQQAKTLSLGDRIVVSGFLAQASYREAERLTLHAQSLDRQD